jgi:hypothetical protein
MLRLIVSSCVAPIALASSIGTPAPANLDAVLSGSSGSATRMALRSSSPTPGV